MKRDGFQTRPSAGFFPATSTRSCSSTVTTYRSARWLLDSMFIAPPSSDISTVEAFPSGKHPQFDST
jgi:hypothetical protein